MTEIPKLVLDPENEDELLALAIDRTREASQGVLSDFSPGSPLAAILEGQVFTIAELLYYLNLLPEALALESFRLLGITRNQGTYATGYLNFQLVNSLGNNFVLPAGYRLPNGEASWVLEEQLLIPSGALEASVLVTSDTVGSQYNLDAYGYVNTNPGLNFVGSIFNPEPITGGTDLEDLADTVTRAQNVLRSRQALVSLTDYEVRANSLTIGASKCIPFLNSDKTNHAPGQVHCFITDALGIPGTNALCDSVKAQMSPDIFAASNLWVSPLELLPVNIEVNVGCENASEPLGYDIEDAIETYLSPLSYPWGEKLRLSEIAYIVRQVTDVLNVDSVLFNGQAVDISMPNSYTCPQSNDITINMMQGDAIVLTLVGGQGDGDPV
jgi:hypothetical protein